jgi:hypothetical protein
MASEVWPETRRAWRRLKAAIADYRKARAEYHEACVRILSLPPPTVDSARRAATEAQKAAYEKSMEGYCPGGPPKGMVRGTRRP